VSRGKEENQSGFLGDGPSAGYVFDASCERQEDSAVRPTDPPPRIQPAVRAGPTRECSIHQEVEHTMKVTKRPALVVEVLESRLVPATIRFDGANLFISNPRTNGGASSVTVTQGVGTAFQVQDNLANNGTFAVSGGISIQGNNAKDTFAVSPTATGLNGNLSISTGNGVASITVDGNGAPGLLSGNTAITIGAGGGTVNLGTASGLTDNGQVTLRNLGTLAATLNVGSGANNTFTGNIYTGNFNTVNLGNAAFGDTYRGNVTVQDTNDPQNTTVTLSTKSTILGDLTVLGGTLVNAVNVNGNLGDNLAVTLPGSSNSLTLAGGGANITIGGSVAYNSGSGATTFVGNGGHSATIQGSLTLNWGNGANSLGLTTGLTVNGDFTVFDGNGGFDGGTSKAAGAFTPNTFKAAVAGNVTLNLGNGANTFVFDGTNGAKVGGTFIVNGGNGGNTIAVTNAPGGPAQLIKLNLSLGNSGANVFWLGSANGLTRPAAATVQGTVNFGPPSAPVGTMTTPFVLGNNYFQPNGYVWMGFITLMNPP
jgi:hypothetical protein